MRATYGIVAIIAAIACVTLGVLGMYPVMTVTFLLAIGFLGAASFSKVKASLSGIEAETRAVIDEARATLKQLVAVAKLAARTNLGLVSRGNRWGGYSFEEKEETRAMTEQALREAGVPPAEIESMFAEWHMVNRFDYTFYLLNAHQVPEELRNKPDLHNEWSALRAGGFARIPSPDQIEAFLRKAGMMTEEHAALLEDYRFYEREHRHRRPQIWKALVDRDR